MKNHLKDNTKQLSDSVDKLKDEISERRRTEESLKAALEESQRREHEISALLESARTILKYHDFSYTAREIFDSCKKLIGASAGYVALLSADGSENEVLFLDAGGLPCTVDPNLPMPIRGLRAEAYHELRAVYDNDFHNSEWMKFMPGGHVRLNNVLFAPLVVEGKAVGLLGIANKPGDFTDNDARMAMAFSELASISLYNNWLIENLSRSEERFHKLVETANDAIVSIDSCGNIISWNNGAEAIFGYSAGEVVGKTLTLIIPERFREAHTKGMNKLLATGVARLIGKTIELIGLRRDGAEFPIELSLTSWKTKAGAFFTGIIRDITERKKAEEEIRKLNLELTRHSDELEAANRELESFSYSVSHDLRAPLRAIDGFSKALLEDYNGALDDEGKRLLQVVRYNAARMGLLIDDILTFSRVGRKDIEIFDIKMEELAREVSNEIMSLAAEKSARIEIKAMPPALGDRSMIRQVFINLFSNAFKFTGKRADAAIEAGSIEAGLEPGAMNFEKQQNMEKQNIYYVKDNGVGFDMHYSDRLFGVFQRLHSSEEFEGTGIGLAIVKRIINKHGGRVWAEGKINGGAVFYFTLPGE